MSAINAGISETVSIKIQAMSALRLENCHDPESRAAKLK